jgi:hypothetical protein
MLLAFMSLGQPGLPMEQIVLVQILDAVQHALQDRYDQIDVLEAIRESFLEDLTQRAALHQFVADVRRFVLGERKDIIDQVFLRYLVQFHQRSLGVRARGTMIFFTRLSDRFSRLSSLMATNSPL